jgi:hypothetical protein
MHYLRYIAINIEYLCKPFGNQLKYMPIPILMRVPDHHLLYPSSYTQWARQPFFFFFSVPLNVATIVDRRWYDKVEVTNVSHWYIVTSSPTVCQYLSKPW